MVVHAPHYVPAVPPNVKVLGLRREHERIERQMGLDEAAMGLGPDPVHHGLERWKHHVEPRRHFRDRQVFLAIEDHLADDLLHPGRAGFRPGTDDDVVVTKLEIVPYPRVEESIVDFPRLRRPCDLFCSHWVPLEYVASLTLTIQRKEVVI